MIWQSVLARGAMMPRSVLKTLLLLGVAMHACGPAMTMAATMGACGSDRECLDQLEILLDAGREAETGAPSEHDGVSISVDGEALTGSVGEPFLSAPDTHDIAINVTFDGLGGERLLSASTVPERRIHDPAAPIGFVANWNYPEWIASGEIRIYHAGTVSAGSLSAIPYAIVPLGPDGRASWTPPSTIENDGSEFAYTVRVHDREGRYDETTPLALVIRSDAMQFDPADGQEIPDRATLSENRPGYNEDRIAVSNIPLSGGVVTVHGRNVPAGYQPEVMGRVVPVSGGEFLAHTILAPGEHVIDIAVHDLDGAEAVSFEREVSIPDNEWFYVGIADLTVGKRTGRDSASLVPARSGEYDSVYRKGRLAFYLKGKVKGEYILTAALDTREEDLDALFSNLDAKDPRQLLRRLDPDDYYPVYGDNSTLREDAPTSGRFYVRIDKGKNHVMWGNFKVRVGGTEFARYERGLYGAHAELQTDGATRFGEPLARMQAFAAQPGTLPQRDEFLGTGGSVYFLKRQDINQGSEQVTIEVRDPATGLVVDRRALREGGDYTIDYVQGVIILSQPLSSSINLGGPVLPPVIGGYQQFLVVTYEYTPALDDVEGYSFGARGEAWVFDALRFGVTGFRETTGIADQSLIEADLTWRLGQESYFQIEWAQSEGDGFGAVRSSDGGFIFNSQPANSTGDAAEAWRARLLLDMAEMTGGSIKGQLSLGYEQREKGFNAPGRYTSENERIYDGRLQVEISDKTTATGGFSRVEHDGFLEKQEGSGSVKIRLDDDYSVETGLTLSDARSAASLDDGTGNRLDAGVRLTRHFFGDDKVYVFGQATAMRDPTRGRNDRVGAGYSAELTDKLSTEGEFSWGTSGPGLQASLSYEPTVSDRYYLGYRITPDTTAGDMNAYDPFGRDNGSVIVGSRREISENTVAWTEHDFDFMGTSQGLIHSYGLEFTPEPVWKLSAGIEAGTIVDEIDGDFERYAPSLAASYTEDKKNFNARLEARFENSAGDSSRDRTTWLAKGGMALQQDDDWRFLANVEAVISQSSQDAVLDGDFIEGSIGWAYRPVANDRLNALFKYTYMHDLPGPQQVNADNVTGGPKQRSHVISADFIYDLNQWWAVGGKYGYRTGEISASRIEADFERSTAHLGIARLDYHLVKNWDLFGEVRGLWLSELEQVQYGALLGVYRHLGDNMKFGVGYNFGRFSDDLTDLTLDDEGVFVNVVGKF